MPKKLSLSNQEFLRRVRDYLPMDAAVWTTDEQGRPCSCAISGGMEEDRFYLFDAEAVLSASRAIEELALEEASGSLLATMQDFKYFAPYRERYWRLAATLDRVRVIAKGRTPPPRDHVKFLACVPRALAPFWTVLYEGVRTRALLICRQTNGTDLFERKRFVGFYTLDASQIARVRHDIEQILAGKRVKMVEFERLMAIDRAAKRIDAFFDRERKEVESAIRKWQIDGDRYHSGRFAADLDKSLSRFKQLSALLSDLIESSGQSRVA